MTMDGKKGFTTTDTFPRCEELIYTCANVHTFWEKINKFKDLTKFSEKKNAKFDEILREKIKFKNWWYFEKKNRI